jgi:hypothetical protein
VGGHLDIGRHPGKLARLGDDGVVGLEEELEDGHSGADELIFHDDRVQDWRRAVMGLLQELCVTGPSSLETEDVRRGDLSQVCESANSARLEKGKRKNLLIFAGFYEPAHDGHLNSSENCCAGIDRSINREYD